MSLLYSNNNNSNVIVSIDITFIMIIIVFLIVTISVQHLAGKENHRPIKNPFPMIGTQLRVSLSNP